MSITLSGNDEAGKSYLIKEIQNKIMKKTILNFFKNTDLDNSFLVGYYGAGNFGDELLLEIILSHLQINKKKNISFYYDSQVKYDDYHNCFGYKKVNPINKIELLRNIFLKKNIIIGGGGLWGLDSNFRVFIFFLLTFISAIFFRTNVYAIGVGYYNSTNIWGRMGAVLIGKIAKKIIVRDSESFINFSKYSKNTYQDNDLAFYIPNNKPKKIINIPMNNNFSYLIFHREMRGKKKESYEKFLSRFLSINKKDSLLFIGDTPEIAKTSHLFCQKKSRELQIPLVNMIFNPIDFFCYLKENKNKIIVIAPQFHIIVICLIFKIKFLPLSYDNKVDEIYKQFSISEENIINIENSNNIDVNNIKHYLIKNEKNF